MGLEVALLEAQHGERDVRAVVGDALVGGDDRSARPLSRPSVFLAPGTGSAGSAGAVSARSRTLVAGCPARSSRGASLAGRRKRLPLCGLLKWIARSGTCFASAPASSGALAAFRPAPLLHGPRHRRGEERQGREDREQQVLLYLRRGHCQTREVRHRQAPVHDRGGSEKRRECEKELGKFICCSSLIFICNRHRLV